jgi:hypothetical protein
MKSLCLSPENRRRYSGIALVSTMISPLFMGRWGNLLLYLRHVSLELAKWNTLLKHLVDLGWCPLELSQPASGKKEEWQTYSGSFWDYEPCHSDGNEPRAPKEKPSTDPPIGRTFKHDGRDE